MTAPGKRTRDTNSDDALVRSILEGTASHTGPEFFSALVQHLSLALDVAGAWVTEFDSEQRRLRAFAFWFRDHFIPDFEYAVDGTPCQDVVDKCSLIHVPDNIIELFPDDLDLAPLAAVSYLGMPLVDSHGLVFGHLGALDTKPLALTPRIEGVFRVFAARAGAEIQRLRAEAALHERERELASLLDGAWDAILVIDQQGVIRQANKSCAETLQIPLNALIGREFTSLLGHSSAQAWRSQMDRIQSGSISQRHFWIGDLDVVDASGGHLAAEATLSYFERNSAQFWTIILRDLNERYEAERQLAALRDESRYLRDELAELLPVGAMTGECEPMRQVFAQIRLVAATEATVLICGETGTGKELAARAIHDFSPRRAKPMIRVNCAAIPASLIESEFFGHERGAFTGATQRRDGRFALADGGTLFLDEIGELPLDLQSKLLRVLQEGEFEPVGSSRTRKVDVRIIAATNRDLRQESEQGRFRSDLFYRLNVFPIRIPALRERGEDIVLLAESFLNRYGEKLGSALSPIVSCRIESPARLRLAGQRPRTRKRSGARCDSFSQRRNSPRSPHAARRSAIFICQARCRCADSGRSIGP